MDAWDLVLLIVVSYLAVMALVKLMLARRDQVVKDLRMQLDEQMRQRKLAAKNVKNSRAA